MTNTVPVVNNAVSVPALVAALAPYFVAAPTPAPPPSTGLAVKRSGSTLVDGNGNALQLRGVNVSGLETTAVHQWAKNADGTYNYWGDSGLVRPDKSPGPDWPSILAWKANAVRIPLNASSWLGLSCVDGGGAPLPADPATTRGYQAAVLAAVTGALAAGLYVILDLHWSAPKLTINGAVHYLLPDGQAPFADANTCLTFWEQVATAYKGMPGVMFELFNEPFLDSYGGVSGGGDQWPLMLNGGSGTQFPNNTGAGAFNEVQAWPVLGFQQMTNAIRAAGASNLLLVSCPSYAQNLQNWLANKVVDPLNNFAAVWHAYPAYGAAYGSPAYALPNFGAQAYTWAQDIVTAGFPLVISECGDQCSAGTVGAPFLSPLLAWVDQMQSVNPGSVSVLAWAWDLWQNANDVLVTSTAGAPTPGEGQVFNAWLTSK
jgi:endoglucanase